MSTRNNEVSLKHLCICVKVICGLYCRLLCATALFSRRFGTNQRYAVLEDTHVLPTCNVEKRQMPLVHAEEKQCIRWPWPAAPGHTKDAPNWHHQANRAYKYVALLWGYIQCCTITMGTASCDPICACVNGVTTVLDNFPVHFLCELFNEAFSIETIQHRLQDDRWMTGKYMKRNGSWLNRGTIPALTSETIHERTSVRTAYVPIEFWIQCLANTSLVYQLTNFMELSPS
jgi:hypothetical protein